MTICILTLPENVRELRNLVERITILSANETKSNINKIIEDILSPSSTISNQDILENLLRHL